MKSRSTILFSLIVAIIVALILLITTTRTSLKNTLVALSQKAVSGPISAIPSASLEENLTRLFSKLELGESDYSSRAVSDSSVEIRASIPRGKPLEWIVWKLSTATSGTAYTIDDCVQTAGGSCTIYFKSNNEQHKPVTLFITRSKRYFSNTASMAIIIEEFEFKADQTTVDFLSFSERLTFAIVPTQPRASRTAELAAENEKEVLVMLPMEPLPRGSELHSSQIMIHYAENRIRNIYSQALQNITGVSGIANFHGSRVLQDSRVMEILLSETKRRGLYFIDTDITSKSTVPGIARNLAVASMTVQGRIGHSESTEQIRNTIRRFAVVSQKTGRVLLIAPSSAPFLNTLREELPNLRSNGIQLVYVSDLF